MKHLKVVKHEKYEMVILSYLNQTTWPILLLLM
jgi:hypothetical protein